MPGNRTNCGKRQRDTYTSPTAWLVLFWLLNVQKAVFVTEDELNRVNGDVVPKIMPTNSEGVE